MIIKKLAAFSLALGLPAVFSGALAYVHPLLALLVIVPLAVVTLTFAFVGLARSRKQYDVAFNGVPLLASAIFGAAYGSSFSQ